jgi:hypothetical protein
VKVDERYTGKMIRHFSSYMDNLPTESRLQLETLFTDDQSDEFYAGLLSGLAAAETLRRHDQQHLLQALVAFVASKLEAKEVI